MIIKDIRECHEFVGGDNTILREVLRPDSSGLPLRYSLAHAVVKPGQTSLPHMLKASSEVYYILSGQGVMHIGDESAEVGNGQAIYIPPGAMQFIENVGDVDLVFLCIVDPAWTAEDEIVL